MAKKVKFWKIKNVLVTLKAMVTGIVTSLILFLPLWLGRWLVLQDRIVIGRGVQLVSFLAGLLIWGYLAGKFWKWK